MNPVDYLFAFRKITEEMCALTAAKNRDYAGEADAFANFRLVEQIGLCPTEVGILTRLSDKLARVGRLLNKEAAVKTESVEDTCLDMAVYSIILLVYLRNKSAGAALGGLSVVEYAKKLSEGPPYRPPTPDEIAARRETDEEYYRRHGNRMKRLYAESDETAEAAARLAR